MGKNKNKQEPCLKTEVTCKWNAHAWQRVTNYKLEKGEKKKNGRQLGKVQISPLAEQRWQTD